jgi:hypothetical protein
MSRITLRLPATLHRELETLAQREQTSLNQYIVYTLTRQVTGAYTVRPLSEEEVSSQQERFHTLLQELGHTSSEEATEVLTGREIGEPEAALNPEIVQRLQNRLTTRRAKPQAKKRATRRQASG